MATVTITCPDCQKQIKAPDSIVGKKIRCKGCEHTFTAEADKPSAGPAPAKKAPDKGKAPEKAKAPDKAAPPPPKPRIDDDDGDGKAYGITTTDLAPRCPQCANEMESEGAVVCLFCGFNTLTREKAETRKIKEVTGNDQFMWLLPGILAAVGFFALIGLIIGSIIYAKNFESDSEFAKFLQQGVTCVTVWTCVFSLYGMYKSARFAIKRLIEQPNPPEELEQ
jgi:DNA-directed RNA polymerase subunit RPC12/RpoP